MREEDLMSLDLNVVCEQMRLLEQEVIVQGLEQQFWQLLARLL